MEKKVIILSESKKLEDLNKIGNFSALKPEKIEEIAELDPTYKGNGYAGKFTIWLIDKYLNGELSLYGTQDITSALKNFMIMRNELAEKNINRLSVDDIMSLATREDSDTTEKPWIIQDFPSVDEMCSRIPSAMYLKLYDDGVWQEFMPLTYEAARKLGGSTKWCTSSSDDKMFDLYIEQYDEPLLIFYKDGVPYSQYQYNGNGYYDVFDKPFLDAFDELPQVNSDVDLKARKYFFAVRMVYQKKRYDTLMKQHITVNSKIPHLHLEPPEKGNVGSYRDYGMWGIARYENNGSVKLLTVPLYGPPLYKRGGFIAMYARPDFVYDISEAFEYDTLFFDSDANKIGTTRDYLDFLSTKLSDGSISLSDMFDSYMNADMLYFLDDENYLCFTFSKMDNTFYSVSREDYDDIIVDNLYDDNLNEISDGLTMSELV